MVHVFGAFGPLNGFRCCSLWRSSVGRITPMSSNCVSVSFSYFFLNRPNGAVVPADCCVGLLWARTPHWRFIANRSLFSYMNYSFRWDCHRTSAVFVLLSHHFLHVRVGILANSVHGNRPSSVKGEFVLTLINFDWNVRGSARRARIIHQGFSLAPKHTRPTFGRSKCLFEDNLVPDHKITKFLDHAKWSHQTFVSVFASVELIWRSNPPKIEKNCVNRKQICKASLLSIKCYCYLICR